MSRKRTSSPRIPGNISSCYWMKQIRFCRQVSIVRLIRIFSACGKGWNQANSRRMISQHPRFSHPTSANTSRGRGGRRTSPQFRRPRKMLRLRLRTTHLGHFQDSHTQSVNRFPDKRIDQAGRQLVTPGGCQNKASKAPSRFAMRHCQCPMGQNSNRI